MRELLTPTKLRPDFLPGRAAGFEFIFKFIFNLIPMYLIAIGWIYVALMMSVAEATNTNGSILGAVITFLLYGVGPAALLMYILGTPARRRKRGAVEQTQFESQQKDQASTQPDAGSQSAAHPITAMREKE